MREDFETIYARCRNACYSAFKGLPYDDIEDALQSAMIEVWESLSARPGNTQAWYVQRSVYYARTYLRDRIWRHDNRQTTLGTASDDDEDDYFQPAITEDGYEEVEADSILTHLPIQTRKIAALLADGYTQEEAARIIGTSRGTVKRRLTEARVSLRAAA
jgi:RNA polymerase sigma factor (sigma-70 family)